HPEACQSRVRQGSRGRHLASSNKWRPRPLSSAVRTTPCLRGPELSDPARHRKSAAAQRRRAHVRLDSSERKVLCALRYPELFHETERESAGGNHLGFGCRVREKKSFQPDWSRDHRDLRSKTV